ncbi:hypothetical protein [Enterococcus sp. HY326]|uniref:hypothetical protein n=1 Tax=Enterococcus sp. HY326 TaxID=2971265 RepID=UPI00223F8714|nr:hypothetical protein [Enterococcus sp. HY326]
MEMNDKFFKLQITKQDVLKMLLFGSSVMAGIIVIIGFGVYLLYKSFRFDGSATLFWIFKSFSAWNFIPILVCLGVIFWISSIFFFQSLRDIIFLVKYQGILFYMDTKGIQFYNFDTKEFKIKNWSEFEDVGCFKQESEKLLYKYQIKFTDGDVYDFDLRGTIPTKEFKDKIEEFYLKYSE